MKPQLIITKSTPHEMALVRGIESEPATRACCTQTRRYSRESRGWIIPLAEVDDLLAFASYYHMLAVVHEHKPGGPSKPRGSA